MSCHFLAQSEGGLLITIYPDVYILIGASVRATFIVFASVLIAKIVIEEYKNNTILLLFSYPISRKKIINRKLMLIIFDVHSMMLSNIVVAGLFSIINIYFSIVPFTLTVNQFLGEVINIVPFVIASTGMSYIPLDFGMSNHSVLATIGLSLIVVAIACAYNPAISLVTFILLQLGLAAVGGGIAYLGIRNIEKVDGI